MNPSAPRPVSVPGSPESIPVRFLPGAVTRRARCSPSRGKALARPGYRTLCRRAGVADRPRAGFGRSTGMLPGVGSTRRLSFFPRVDLSFCASSRATMAPFVPTSHPDFSTLARFLRHGYLIPAGPPCDLRFLLAQPSSLAAKVRRGDLSECFFASEPPRGKPRGVLEGPS
jgi:hypothetical protein